MKTDTEGSGREWEQKSFRKKLTTITFIVAPWTVDEKGTLLEFLRCPCWWCSVTVPTTSVTVVQIVFINSSRGCSTTWGWPLITFGQKDRDQKSEGQSQWSSAYGAGTTSSIWTLVLCSLITSNPRLKGLRTAVWSDWLQNVTDS